MRETYNDFKESIREMLHANRSRQRQTDVTFYNPRTHSARYVGEQRKKTKKKQSEASVQSNTPVARATVRKKY